MESVFERFLSLWQLIDAGTLLPLQTLVVVGGALNLSMLILWFFS